MSIKIGNFEIRPEIDQPVYYVHLGIILAVTYGVMQILPGQDPLVLASIGLFLGDILAHSLLKLD